jgi:hypothetical protein
MGANARKTAEKYSIKHISECNGLNYLMKCWERKNNTRKRYEREVVFKVCDRVW